MRGVQSHRRHDVVADQLPVMRRENVAVHPREEQAPIAVIVKKVEELLQLDL